MDIVQINTSLKCDEDFILVSDEAWDYLSQRYGGQDIPRYSIEVASDESVVPEGDTRTPKSKEYMIEIYYKQLFFYILPRKTQHVVLRKQSAVYVSRKATIGEYHKKIA